MIIIPMAGKSSRFYKAGFDVPKFMLNVYKNSDVFTEAVLSFKKFFTTDFFVFIHRSDDNSEAFINKKSICTIIVAQKHYINCHLFSHTHKN